MKIAVINCGSSKQLYTCPAKELYTGNLFCASRRYCEDNYSQYIILSAKYHMLFPEDIVSPYELYLGNLEPDEKLVWDKITADQIMGHIPNTVQLDFYTSKMYSEGLIPILENNGYVCKTFLNNLGMGYKVQWFKNHCKNKKKGKLF